MWHLAVVLATKYMSMKRFKSNNCCNRNGSMYLHHFLSGRHGSDDWRYERVRLLKAKQRGLAIFFPLLRGRWAAGRRFFVPRAGACICVLLIGDFPLEASARAYYWLSCMRLLHLSIESFFFSCRVQFIDEELLPSKNIPRMTGRTVPA